MLDKPIVHDRMFDTWFGAVAQLGARLPRTEEAVGSNPISSTNGNHDLIVIKSITAKGRSLT